MPVSTIILTIVTLLGASFREDGSSRFGLNNQYGFFPSFSAAWRVSNENFFENAKR